MQTEFCAQNVTEALGKIGYNEPMFVCTYEVENLPHSGRPSRSMTEVNVAYVGEMVTGDPHLDLEEIAVDFSVSTESISVFMTLVA